METFSQSQTRGRGGRVRRLNNRSMRRTPDDNQDDDIIGGSSKTNTRQKKPLNFTQAMSDFQTMFPDIDRAVIETVLRSNDGVVQSTIDQLLVLAETAEVENAGNTPRLPDYDDCRRSQFVDEPPPAYAEVEEDDLLDFGDTIVPPLIPTEPSPPKPAETPQNQAIHQMERLRFWNPPMIGKLPPDFLKLTPQKSEDSPQETFHAGSQAQDTSNDDFLTDRELEQFLEDQKLALYLQNEEFIRQLRRDPDFISSLEEDHREFMQSQLNLSDTASPPAPANSSTKDPDWKTTHAFHGGAKPRHPVAAQDDAAFRTKLRHMGHSTRKKFGKMAKRFARRKPQKFIAHGASTANLLEEDSAGEDNTHTGLEGIQEYQFENTLPSEDASLNASKERTGRRLPTLPPQASKPGNQEPIVFYSEDNEFSYKID